MFSKKISEQLIKQYPALYYSFLSELPYLNQKLKEILIAIDLDIEKNNNNIDINSLYNLKDELEIEIEMNEELLVNSLKYNDSKEV